MSVTLSSSLCGAVLLPFLLSFCCCFCSQFIVISGLQNHSFCCQKFLFCSALIRSLLSSPVGVFCPLITTFGVAIFRSFTALSDILFHHLFLVYNSPKIFN
ncbi:E3 ubiquitin-protein ligase UPL5 -like protein [Gossypium arboreum]|uniref:E3 ubiquitin-protein ligase UPL5-like protein n=1 Tax=Gossypium arboreum TaxID=29729 RepID=A0A0B0NE00_GOSAR|nr:E3 ubiquitin-protein ligase UPL5 -like protein [Gossypium arboreum]